jgi:outer membrane protein assembly factor BamB
MDFFAIKFDPDGNELWRKQWGTEASDMVGAVAVTAAGEVRLGGHTQGAMFGELHGVNDLILVATDTDGGAIWSRQFGTDSGEMLKALTVDAAGNTYCTGQTDGALAEYFGSTDLFVTKFAPDGTLGWNKQIGSPLYDTAEAIQLQGTNLFVAGYTQGTLGRAIEGVGDAVLMRWSTL